MNFLDMCCKQSKEIDELFYSSLNQTFTDDKILAIALKLLMKVLCNF